MPTFFQGLVGRSEIVLGHLACLLWCFLHVSHFYYHVFNVFFNAMPVYGITCIISYRSSNFRLYGMKIRLSLINSPFATLCSYLMGSCPVLWTGFPGAAILEVFFQTLALMSLGL